MKKVYLIQFSSKVKGSDGLFEKGGILYGFKTLKEAFEECERLKLEDEQDKELYLEYKYSIIQTEIY